jgi:hypothetical protein
MPLARHRKTKHTADRWQQFNTQIMKNFVIFLAFISLLPGNTFAINERVSDNNIDFQKIKLEDLLINKSVDTSKLFLIKEDCVFIIQMTTEECDLLEKSNPDEYESFSENANNDAEKALELFEKLSIKNIWSDKRYIQFDLQNMTYLIDTRRKELAGRYCIIFKKSSTPVIMPVESLDMDTLKKCFK